MARGYHLNTTVGGGGERKQNIVKALHVVGIVVEEDGE